MRLHGQGSKSEAQKLGGFCGRKQIQSRLLLGQPEASFLEVNELDALACPWAPPHPQLRLEGHLAL